MLHIINCILPIFLIIFSGFLAKKFKPLDASFWAGCNKIVYYFFFPALLINAITTTNLNVDIHQSIVPLIGVTLVFAAVLIILQMIFKIDGKTFSSIFQGIVRYNSYIYMGVTVALFGHKVLPIVAIVITYMIIVTNILSVIILSVYASHQRIHIKNILLNLIKNPLILACIIGTIWNETPIPYPDLIAQFLQHIGGAALPVSLMCVGAGLQFNHVLSNIKLVIVVNVVKLIVYPLAVLFILNYFHCSGLTRDVVLTYALIPCAGNAYILAKQMGGDHELMSTLLCTMVLCSVVTIPVMVHFLGLY